MKDRVESEYDALADWNVKVEEANKAFENSPMGKYARALGRARARHAARTPAQKAANVVSTATPTLKELEHIDLSGSVGLLQRNDRAHLVGRPNAEIFTAKIGLMGFSIDIKALARWAWWWWKSR